LGNEQRLFFDWKIIVPTAGILVSIVAILFTF
jgi:hypothetical protein